MVATTLAGLLLAAFTQLAAGLLSPDQSAACDCYSTSGSSNGLYTHYALYDFRHQSQHAGVPPLITTSDETMKASVTSDFFKASNWTDNWDIQTWSNDYDNGNHGDDSTIQMTNSANNIYIETNTDDQSDTYLTLRSARLPNFQTVAEFDASEYQFQFVSSRMYARVVGDPGTCASMFSYEGSTSPVQEADIEFLTKDPKNVGQYTNQPGDAPNSTSNSTLPVPIDQWAVHRYDWQPGVSTWYVDDQQVAQIHVNTPRRALLMIFNNWSNGNEWTGVMNLGESAYLHIQWIEIAYNTTVTNDPSKSANRLRRRAATAPTCTNVCHLDDSQSSPTVPPVHGPAAPATPSSPAVSNSPVVSPVSPLPPSPPPAPPAVHTMVVPPPAANSTRYALPLSPPAVYTAASPPAASPLSPPRHSHSLPPPAVLPAVPPPAATLLTSSRPSLPLPPPPAVQPAVPQPATTLLVSPTEAASTVCTAGGVVFDILVHQEVEKALLARRSVSASAAEAGPVWRLAGTALMLAALVLLL